MIMLVTAPMSPCLFDISDILFSEDLHNAIRINKSATGECKFEIVLTKVFYENNSWDSEQYI